ncbi:MAG: PTS sugar transporter subunit IIB [Hungatella sp.]|jgi:PTS system cellobiose-specific IIB component|nr:PTS sugar transporter subunit IIB [Hungatella sp.]
MKIILACAAGMSTSMLVERMKESADQKGMELEIDAVPVSSLSAHTEATDIILLGPQVSYMEDKVAADYPAIPVRVIEMLDYGMMNGEKVLADALSQISR